MPAPSPSSDSIQWTCLPNGLDNAAAGGPKLRIAVMVSPRLASASLGIFSNWTSVVLGAPPNALTFTVDIMNGPSGVPASRVTLDPSVALDPALWGKIFPASLLVRPYHPAVTASRFGNNISKNKGIQSYSVRNVASQIKAIYQGVEPVAVSTAAGGGSSHFAAGKDGTRPLCDQRQWRTRCPCQSYASRGAHFEDSVTRPRSACAPGFFYRNKRLLRQPIPVPYAGARQACYDPTAAAFAAAPASEPRLPSDYFHSGRLPSDPAAARPHH